MTDEPTVKEKVVLALRHDYAVRDFYESGVLRELAERFDLYFLCENSITYPIEQFGKVLPPYQLGGLRRRVYWIAAGLWHIHYKQKFEVRARHAVEQAVFGVGPKISKVIRWLYRCGLAWPMSQLCKGLLKCTRSNVIPAELELDGILVYTSVRSHFCDDLVREAKRKKIPLLALTNNWDNLNTKSFLEKPPYLAVWGEQGYLIARLLYQFPAYRTFVTGAPRFEIYKRNTMTAASAREQYGWSSAKRHILFCGAGVPFDELTLLAQLDKAISAKMLPSDIHILYKPHPLSFVRTNARRFEDYGFVHVTRVETPSNQLTSLSIYSALFAVAKAVISPFSTMVMEGALHGLPALCMGYNASGHANHDWGRSAFNLHLYLIRHAAWSVICEHPEQFISGCQALIKMIDDDNLAMMAKGAAEMVFKYHNNPVTQTLSNAMETVMHRAHADNSYLHSAEYVEAKHHAETSLNPILFK